MAIVFASVGGEDGGCVELGVGVGGGGVAEDVKLASLLRWSICCSVCLEWLIYTLKLLTVLKPEVTRFYI